MLPFEEEILGWAYVNYKAYHAEIILFDGKVTKVGENMWQVSTDHVHKIRDSEFGEKYDDSDKIINDSSSGMDFRYKVMFSGKITETDNKEYVLINSFINFGLNYETIQNVRFSQIVDTVNSESVVANQNFRSLILIG